MASPNPTTARRVRRAPLLLGATAASALALAGSLAFFGTGEEGFVRANRYLARLAFLLFLPPFTASALARLWPSEATRALVRGRRSLGLAYAIAQLTHAAAIVAMFRLTPVEAELDPSLVVGGLGMVFVALMAATSNDRAVRALGRGWRRLHGTGIWLLWAIYVFTYVGRVAGGDLSHAPLLALALAALGLRVAAGLRRQRVAAPA